MSVDQDFQPGPIRVHNDLTLQEFDVNVFYGGQWLSLNDNVNFIVFADSLQDKAQSRRRIMAESPVYDGEFEVHSVKGNVQETINVRILGQSQNQVTENFLLLVDAFEQSRYSVQIRMGDHLETWLCMPAEWNLDRSHIYVHNTMAVLKLSIPRFPKVTYEVVM